MEDQFGGRTDDDLFADDFEPVAASSEPVEVPPAAETTREAVQEAPRPPPVETTSHPREGQPEATSQDGTSAQTTSKPETSTTPAAPPTAPKQLSQSRHNRPAPSARPAARQPPASNNNNTNPPPPSSNSQSNSSGPAAPESAATNPPEKYDPKTRLQSGVNPRTKLTDEELTAKMEKMRILSAEKTRRFEQAQRDESDHRIALARSIEETRKRRAAEDEKRRRGEEDRRRMDEERARNRERKLQAMGQKEGGWDEGKEERLAEEDRRGFRGANGGIRGTKNVGLTGSRFAVDDSPDDRRDFAGDRGSRGRGRGRGNMRGGRGGRGTLFDADAGSGRNDGATRNTAPRQNPSKPAVMSKDDFPALPPAAPPAATTATKNPPPIQNPLSPLSPRIGKWDDEMAAIDALNAHDH